VTVHVPVPLQAPFHPRNTEVLFATAVSVTEVPALYLALQAVPQFTMPSAEDTVPLPRPDFVTVSVYCVAGGGGAETVCVSVPEVLAA
jgi:hypothetical protein